MNWSWPATSMVSGFRSPGVNTMCGATPPVPLIPGRVTNPPSFTGTGVVYDAPWSRDAATKMACGLNAAGVVTVWLMTDGTRALVFQATYTAFPLPVAPSIVSWAVVAPVAG